MADEEDSAEAEGEEKEVIGSKVDKKNTPPTKVGGVFCFAYFYGIF